MSILMTFHRVINATIRFVSNIEIDCEKEITHNKNKLIAAKSRKC